MPCLAIFCQACQVEDNADDLMQEPLETEEELAALCEKLTEKTYREKMVTEDIQYLHLIFRCK